MMVKEFLEHYSFAVYMHKETAMVELTELSEARQKIQELREKMLVLKEHL